MDFSGPIAAVFEKDLRTLLRSGPMLYNLAAPLVMAVVFGGAMHGGQFSQFRVEYALPVGMVWAFLGLTRLVCNNLGGEGAGLQFYFLSPTPLRTVVLGKNLLHLTLFVLEAAVIAALVVFRFGEPSPSIVAATVAWILFAVPANFTAGNLLSVRMPYRLNLARIRREPGALGNGLISVLVQFSLLAVGGVVVVPCQAFGHPWAAPAHLCVAGGGERVSLSSGAGGDQRYSADPASKRSCSNWLSKSLTELFRGSYASRQLWSSQAMSEC